MKFRGVHGINSGVKFSSIDAVERGALDGEWQLPEVTQCSRSRVWHKRSASKQIINALKNNFNFRLFQ